jgi:glucosylceramidase
MRIVKFFLLVPAALLLTASSLWAQEVRVYRTTPDLKEALYRDADLKFTNAKVESPPDSVVIEVDARRSFQVIDGFGASLTDSSAWLLHDQLSASTREEVMGKLFDPEKGIGISFLRQPIGASDLARNHYSFDDMPAGERDPELAHFSIQHDEAYILPVVREALTLNPAISVMVTPWSPPGWMKTHDSMIGGQLRDDAFAEYANYLVKSIEGYQKAGVPVKFLSVQNEPLYETKDYPGTLMIASQQKKFIGGYLGPALRKAGLDTKILAYDHNWDHPEYPLEVMSDPEAGRFVAGSAFHCYGGDVAAQSDVHSRYPEKGLWMTECSGGTWQKGNLLAVTAQLLIESTRNWAQAVVLWGIALDEKHGPNSGGCDTCRGFVTVDRSTTPHRVIYTEDYYAIGHASRFVHPGARRISSPDFGRSGLETVSFQNKDGSIVLLVLNNASTDAAFAIRWEGKVAHAKLSPGALATYEWK